MLTQFNNNFSRLNLLRFPIKPKQTLQAWDAADEFLLQNLYTDYNLKNDVKILIFNDSFGAISLALHQYSPTIMTDSYISQQAIIANCTVNQIDVNSIKIINSLSTHEQYYNYILIKIPKSLDYLHYFLTKLRTFIDSKTIILAAGMVKHMPKSLWNMLEDNLGKTTTSLTKKKAKLINIKVEKNHTATAYPIHFRQEHTQFEVYNHANVFSKQSLDIGTRFLLQNLPALHNIQDIIDLGCGNGVVGLNLSILYPDANIVCTDESYMAVASAKLTIKHNIGSATKFKFKVDNCLDSFAENSADLIVCNPPFHQSHSIGTHIAMQMFKQSHKTLNKNGYLIVIANRHLPYYSHLKGVFKHVKTIASNQKFNIFLLSKY
ncbi:23S rRNA (guanine(1835)-N(2))-methyltransferase [hydrothermal vent metagenome]|uniref:23S rRNA (Guanine(1835)-N(2))-methyltransferase n=1 Tax=hydrothermal vent metagenome TaxID=652676 RepID=A0A3B0VTH9_9ZZZZ